MTTSNLNNNSSIQIIERQQKRGVDPTGFTLTRPLASAMCAVLQSNVTEGDVPLSAAEAISRIVIQGLLTGHLTFPDGRSIPLSTMEWSNLMRFVAVHIDGPASLAIGNTPVDAVNVNITQWKEHWATRVEVAIQTQQEFSSVENTSDWMDYVDTQESEEDPEDFIFSDSLESEGP